MKNINVIVVIICLAILVGNTNAQTIVIEAGATISNTGNGIISSDGDLTIDGLGNFSGNGTLEVKGNFNYNSQPLWGIYGTLKLNGTSQQTIGGANVFYTNRIDFNNPAGFVLNRGLTATGIVNFNAGIINIPQSHAVLLLGYAAGIGVAASNTAHVNGFLVRNGTGNLVFPVGNGTQLQQVEVNTSINTRGVYAKYNIGNGGSGSSSSELDSYNSTEFWDIGPYAQGEATGAVTIYWDNETSTIPLSERKVAHKSGLIIKNEGGTVSGTSTLANGSVTSSPVSTWSPFMLGFKALGGPLPVELISFKGKATEKGNELEWKIASEKNFSHYDVERSNDAKSFKVIGKINGAGNTKEKLIYNFIDGPLTPEGGMLSENSNPLIFSQPNTNTHQSTPPLGAGGLTRGLGSGLYYRLSLIDLDGTKKLSNIIFVDRKLADISIASVFPNPVINSMTVSYNSEKESEADLTIFDFSGKLIYENKLIGEIGSNSKEIDVKNWQAGAYLVKISDGQNQTIRKILKR
jgi:Secretion system C-terminal sorting domain